MPALALAGVDEVVLVAEEPLSLADLLVPESPLVPLELASLDEAAPSDEELALDESELDESDEDLLSFFVDE